MPSLSTSLCMLSGPGALPLLRNLTNLINESLSGNVFHKLVLISHIKSVVIWVLRRTKILMIILDKFIDFMEVIRIKMIAFYAEMSLDTLSKELRFISVRLGDFACIAQSWIIVLTLSL